MDERRAGTVLRGIHRRSALRAPRAPHRHRDRQPALQRAHHEPGRAAPGCASTPSTTPFGERIVNSVFTLGLLTGLSVYDTTYGTTLGNLGWEEVRFPRPVLIGDTLRAATSVISKRESQSRPDSGIVVFEHRAFNQRDEEVASCRRAPS